MHENHWFRASRSDRPPELSYAEIGRKTRGDPANANRSLKGRNPMEKTQLPSTQPDGNWAYWPSSMRAVAKGVRSDGIVAYFFCPDFFRDYGGYDPQWDSRSPHHIASR